MPSMNNARLSRIQKYTLFTLHTLEARGITSPIPGTKINEIINSSRVIEVFPSNFRASCALLVGRELIERYRNKSLKLAYKLTDSGRLVAVGLAEAMQEKGDF